jgi:hypothetical protein
MLIWAVVAITVGGSVTVRPAAAADPQAEGRKHSRRAAQLAAANKCRAAIGEYDKALAVLKDPALLFNRGECYRRIEDKEHALADYRRFLDEVPDAPNRAAVAARIAELEQGVVAKAPATRPEPGADLNGGSSTPSLLAPDRPAAIAETSKTAPPGGSTGDAAINIAPPLKLADPQIVMVGNEPQQPAKEADSGVTGQWWFWTAVGAVLIGGGVAGYLILNPPKTEIPSSHLGNYIF